MIEEDIYIPTLEAIDIELARNSFLDFVLYTMPNYECQWFHEYLAHKLDAFVAGDIKKMMVFMPPQHGKSELTSRRLPPYIFGKDPKKRIAGLSYNDPFAKKFNRQVQRIIQSQEYARIFPETTLNKKNVATDSHGHWLKNANEFEIVAHGGSYMAVGVGGGITGNPFDYILIDDPIKSRAEADSPAYRKKVWEWWSDDVESRLVAHTQVLITLTRWHEDDLAGSILKEEAEEWEIVEFPAIKEDHSNPDDPREIGEPLWEKAKTKEQLSKIEKKKPRTFTSLYQQRPSPKEGDIIKRAWFPIYSLGKILETTGKGHTMNFMIDSAYTDKEENDQTAIAAFFVHSNIAYIIKCVGVHKEFPELIKFLVKFVKRHGYQKGKSRIYIEPKASGKSIAQQLKKTSGLNVVEYNNTDTDKMSRAIAATPVFESWRVIIAAGAWNEPFLQQLAAFPNMKLKDMVDVSVNIADLLEKGGPISMKSSTV